MNSVTLVIMLILGFVFGNLADIIAGRYLNTHYLKEDFDIAAEGDSSNPADLDYFIRTPVSMSFFSSGHLLMAAVAGILWLLIGYNNSDILTIVLYCVCSLVLIIVAEIDLQVYEIPGIFSVMLLVIGIVRLITDYHAWSSYAVGGILVSGLLALIFLVTKGRGMGLGDAKMMVGIGLLLGWKSDILCLIIGCILGSVIHTVRMKISKKETFLAFGPYLALAAVICMCYGNMISDWYFGYFSAALNG